MDDGMDRLMDVSAKFYGAIMRSIVHSFLSHTSKPSIIDESNDRNLEKSEDHGCGVRTGCDRHDGALTGRTGQAHTR